MVFTMQLRFMSCILLSICHGFLLTNKTGVPSVGTSGLTDYHYLMLTDALGAQKQLLSQMETFVLQLQNQLTTVNQEVKDLKFGNSAVQSLAVVELKNETFKLGEKSAQLQNSYDVLTKKFVTLENENNDLKHDNAALRSQITVWHNMSIHTKQELDFFTHSIAASNIQNITTIQSGMDTLTSKVQSLNSQLTSLSSTSTSRSQDFLALLNKTNTADHKLETIYRWSKSFQNYTEIQLVLLQSHANSSSNRVDSLEQNYTLLTRKLQEMNQPVALTSCALGTVSYNNGETMKFPSTKTSIGINNVDEFKTTGKFTCEKSGVYLFAVHITYHGSSNADFRLLKNSQNISYVMIVYGTHSDNYFSGSGTVVVQMNAGDILLAKADDNINVVNPYSCFTVLKIN